MRRNRIAAAVALALIAAGCGDDSGGGATEFHEFAWQSAMPDVRSQRLCVEAADPDNAADTTCIDCAVEGATFAPEAVETKAQIDVLAYNILRGFEVDAQLAEIRSGVHFPVPDVLLLSEVDRGCRRTQFRNIARDYAEALGYYYVYATEFVELPGDRGDGGPYDPPLCEHGNAIVSRYPLGNVRQIRHSENRSWYTPPGFPDPDEPRLGGRVAVAADMKVGKQLVRLYSLHLESTLTTLRIRDAQAVEIAAEAALLEQPVIAGGDLNAFFAVLDFENRTMRDGPTQAFLMRGFADAHASVPLTVRSTTYDPVPLIIDFIYVRDAAVHAAGVCDRAVCGPLSDHLPVWATVALE
jgi:endonuclease/exonuclease/phosphatase family metal-dependent hydrolase